MADNKKKQISDANEVSAVEVASPGDVEKEQPKESVVSYSARMVAEQHTVVSFRNRAMIQMRDPFPHFVPLTKEMFDRIAYPLLGGVTRSRMADAYAALINTQPDFTYNEHLILFGLEDWSDGAYADSGYYHEKGTTKMWDCELLEWVDTEPAQAVWRSPYGVVETHKPIPFIMSLAGGDEGLYDDIMQSLAPMVMQRKPDGVIWWVGDGANGKSTLMDAIYKIFPGQLASLTVKTLMEAKDTLRLNGTLANIVKESSEGRIEDTEIYKAVGTHEDFSIHKFHSQDTITIRGNLHHIFSANTIPTFNDKGYSARRRTFIVPFTQTFESDPTFEQRTFNSELFGQLIYEMTRYAKRLRDQGYRYKWSSQTLAAKLEYDADANNAEEYAKEIIRQGVVAFDSFNPMKMDYDNWCADNGYVPLGVTNLRRALGALGFDRMSVKTPGGSVVKRYMLPVAKAAELQEISVGRPGMYTIPGFKPAEDKEPEVPEFKEPKTPDPADEETPEEKRTSILNGRW